MVRIPQELRRVSARMLRYQSMIWLGQLARSVLKDRSYKVLLADNGQNVLRIVDDHIGPPLATLCSKVRKMLDQE
jgi:hypothetical protein